MAYGTGHLQVLNSSWIVTTAEDLSAAAADHASVFFGTKVRIAGFGFETTEAVGDATTAAVVSLDHIATDGSTRTEKATLTLDNFAIGGVRRVTHSAFTPFVVNPGERIVFEHKTAASGGTTTGAGHYFVEYYAEPEVPGNQSNVVELAA